MKHASTSSTDVAGFVDRYKRASKQGCEQILELARIIADAVDGLSGKDQDRFFSEVKLDRSGSTYRKLKKVGEQSTRFQPFVSQLPNTWTTLYGLATLEGHEFDKLTGANILHPFIKWREIQAFLGLSGSPKSTLRVAIDLGEVPELRLKDFVRKLQGLLNEYNLKVEASKAMKATLSELLDDEAFQMEQAEAA